MKYSYEPSGVCSYLIEFEIADGIVHNALFHGGCDGNAQGLSKLVEGMPADKVMSLLRGIDCDGKGTSCPDQLAVALERALAGELK
ncbi:MAG TPA: TIGR03905 family TSCPD domain-containing protein [Candidatus Acidoferrum sp.]|nr:TIGR03905 family TSCPD domain-containing protein [Candidatus Acidoferrum sp.]